MNEDLLKKNDIPFEDLNNQNSPKRHKKYGYIIIIGFIIIIVLIIIILIYVLNKEVEKNSGEEEEETEEEKEEAAKIRTEILKDGYQKILSEIQNIYDSTTEKIDKKKFQNNISKLLVHLLIFKYGKQNYKEYDCLEDFRKNPDFNNYANKIFAKKADNSFICLKTQKNIGKTYKNGYKCISGFPAKKYAQFLLFEVDSISQVKSIEIEKNNNELLNKNIIKETSYTPSENDLKTSYYYLIEHIKREEHNYINEYEKQLVNLTYNFHLPNVSFISFEGDFKNENFRDIFLIPDYIYEDESGTFSVIMNETYGGQIELLSNTYFDECFFPIDFGKFHGKLNGTNIKIEGYENELQSISVNNLASKGSDNHFNGDLNAKKLEIDGFYNEFQSVSVDELVSKGNQNKFFGEFNGTKIEINGYGYEFESLYVNEVVSEGRNSKFKGILKTLNITKGNNNVIKLENKAEDVSIKGNYIEFDGETKRFTLEGNHSDILIKGKADYIRGNGDYITIKLEQQCEDAKVTGNYSEILYINN